MMGTCPTTIDNAPIPNESNDSNINKDWIITIEPHAIINGTLRLLLKNSNLFDIHINRIQHVSFKLAHKIRNETEWKFTFFDYRYIKGAPEIHTTIRLDTNLYDYNIQFKITTLFTHKFDENLSIPKLKTNIWCPWSNIIDVNVPSLMKDVSFEINEWVRFLKPNTRNNRKSYGTIISKFQQSDDICIYKILHHRNGKQYEIEHSKSVNDIHPNIKHLSAHSYIDLADNNAIERTLLIGDRIDINNDYVMD
eukprot:176831_1